MRILLTHRFFWPDAAPYGLILKQIAEGLAKDGHEVGIFSAMPSYRSTAAVPKEELIEGVTVRRVRLFADGRRSPIARALNSLWFAARLFATVVRNRPDLVTAATFPPVIAAWSASLAARLVGAKFVYHVQDIHPEVSSIAGGGLGRGLPARLLRGLDNQTLRRSAAVIALTDDMRDTILARGVDGLNIHVIDNPPLQSPAPADLPPVEMRKAQGVIRLIFAGNLGRFQRLEVLVEGIARILPTRPELELCLLGDGDLAEPLKARWGTHPQVRFLPFLPFPQAQTLIEEADVGLVSLRPDMYRVSSPSKLVTYLSLGVPVVALMEPHSRVARAIEQDGLGAVAAGDDPGEIADAVERVLKRRPHPERLRSWSASRNSMEPWRDLIDEIRQMRRAEPHARKKTA